MNSQTNKHKRITSDPEISKRVIHDAGRIIILISGPDDDSIGSGIVLKRYLSNLGKQVRLLSGNPLLSDCKLPLIHELEIADPNTVAFSDYDLIITLDTANPYPQLVNYRVHSSFELPSNPPTLSIDHHLGNEGYADYNLWEPEASSVCEIVWRHFLSDKQLDRDEATLLLFGISYDTGHFRWKTHTQTLTTAARLIAMGGDLNFVVECHYYNYSQRIIELLTKWLSHITYNNQFNYMAIIVSEQEVQQNGFSQEEFRQARVAFGQLFLRAVRGYPIGLFLIKNGQTVRAYIFGSPLENRIDLTQLSLLVGGNGGGHFNASGFTITASVEEAFKRIDNALAQLKPG